jgi:hypothetical protein
MFPGRPAEAILIAASVASLVGVCITGQVPASTSGRRAVSPTTASVPGGCRLPLAEERITLRFEQGPIEPVSATVPHASAPEISTSSWIGDTQARRRSSRPHHVNYESPGRARVVCSAGWPSG